MQTQRECRELNSEIKMLKRQIGGLEDDKKVLLYEVERRDQLIEEAGLVLVEKEGESVPLPSSSATREATPASPSAADTSTPLKKPALAFSQQTLYLLERAYPEGSLDEKIKHILDSVSLITS